jgi:hypothetical protein
LSAVLCDIYYSDLDRTHLREFQKDGDLLIRVVDDYLFITTDLDRAARYVIKEMLFIFLAEAVLTYCYTNPAQDFVSQIKCQASPNI